MIAKTARAMIKVIRQSLERGQQLLDESMAALLDTQHAM
jgi:hypothetical protein